MEYWTFLHTLSMFSGVTLLVGTSVFGGRIIATGGVATIGGRVRVPTLWRAGIAAVWLGSRSARSR